MEMTYNNAVKLALRTFVSSPTAAAAALASTMGSGYKVRVYNASNVQVGTGTAAGSLAASGATVTGSVDVTFSADCDPAAASFYGRIESSAGTYWLRGDVGLPGDGEIFELSAAVANTDVVSVDIELTIPGAVDPGVQPVVAINCGGGAFTDAAGRAYLADIHYLGGTAGSTSSPIAGTVDDTLYQTERWGAYAYSIPVTAATYTVTVHLAEIFSEITAPGQRVFGLQFYDGATLRDQINSIDVYALAGPLTAYTVTRDIQVTGSLLNIIAVTGTQNPKVAAITLDSSSGGAYVPPATGDGGATLAWVKRFKTDAHDARLGLMPTFFDWHATGRPYNVDTNAWRTSDPRIVPWNTIFAAYTKTWPATVGVECGAARLFGFSIASSLWVPLYTWPTFTSYKHNRDDYGAGSQVNEDAGTDTNTANTSRTTNAGTIVVRRSNSAEFPTGGTHIHGYYEGGNSTPSDEGRVSINRTLYSAVLFDAQFRTVGWPASNGLAPITNPSDYDGTSIVACVAADTYSGNGDFASTYGGDIGICRAPYVTNSWQKFFWYTCLPATLDTISFPA